VFRKSLPVFRKSLPVFRKSLPVLRKSLPVFRKSLPVLRESLPVLCSPFSFLPLAFSPCCGLSAAKTAGNEKNCISFTYPASHIFHAKSSGTTIAIVVYIAGGHIDYNSLAIKYTDTGYSAIKGQVTCVATIAAIAGNLP
jgi:hypothetical protein